MKKLLSIFALSFFALNLLLSQVPLVDWNRVALSFPQGENEDVNAIPSDTETDAAGNTTVCGTFTDTLDFGSGFVLHGDQSSTQLYLARYNSEGLCLWAKHFSVADLDSGADGLPINICLDQAGNIYVTGVLLAESIDFGNGIELGRSCVDFCSEIFLAKFNPSGVALWANGIESSNDNFTAPSGLESKDNQIFLYGSYSGTALEFGPNFVFNNLNPNRFFVARYDALLGQPQMVKFFGNSSATNQTFGSSMDINDAGDIAISGTYSGDLNLNNGIVLPQVTAFGDYFTAVLDQNLNTKWARNINSPDYIEILDTEISNSGLVYLAIDFSGGLRLEESLVITSDKEYGAAALWLTESDFGLPAFIPYSGESYPITAVTTDKNDNFFAAGFLDEGNEVEVGGQSFKSSGCFDHLIFKGDFDGVIDWATVAGGEASCEGIANFSAGNSLTTDQAGNLYVTALFYDGFNSPGTLISGSGISLSKYQKTPSGLFTPAVNATPLAISPNPCAEQFRIDLGAAPSSFCQLSIFDQYGRQVHTQSLSDKTNEVRAELPAGVYSILVQDGDQMKRGNVVVH
jgi:Secretion system C-terminal sorting domain